MSDPYWTRWRKARKERAVKLGIPIDELPDMRFEISNKSNYYSPKHENYLYSAAYKTIAKFYWIDLDANELVNVGWWKCARYHKDISREYIRLLVVMHNFVNCRLKGVDSHSKNVPSFVDEADDLMSILPFRVNERLPFHDNTEERVKAIFDLCSDDEKELLYLRFFENLTYKELGKVYKKHFSNMIIKYQRLFIRIRKRLNGEKTRSLRTKLVR